MGQWESAFLTGCTFTLSTVGSHHTDQQQISSSLIPTAEKNNEPTIIFTERFINIHSHMSCCVPHFCFCLLLLCLFVCGGVWKRVQLNMTSDRMLIRGNMRAWCCDGEDVERESSELDVLTHVPANFWILAPLTVTECSSPVCTFPPGRFVFYVIHM